MAACRVLEEPIDLRPRLRVFPLAPPVERGPGGEGTHSYDLVGNRTLLTKSGDDPEYAWDLLNRMTEYQFDDGGGDAVKYTYRADGMRTHKFDTTGDDTEAWYFHDGQMCVQESSDDGTDVTVTKYGVGARGIDVITRKVNSGSETFGYPLYDTHGNMVATLARDGSGYTTGNEKSYDVWGGDRSGSSSVDQGYVANLGHRTDSESGLQYMRARNYEPSTGRFVNQDPLEDGHNWFIYSDNSPTNLVDFGGCYPDWARNAFGAIMWYALVPFWPNPYLAKALNEFNGFEVPEKWQNELSRRVDPYYAYSAGNGLNVASLFQRHDWGRDWYLLRKAFLARATGILSIAEAYSLILWIAMVSCDMAFEDSI